MGVPVERFSYRGKNYEVPVFDGEGGIVLRQLQHRSEFDRVKRTHKVLRGINTTWDLEQFKVARAPLPVGLFKGESLAEFSQPRGIRVLDMPIKFPDCDEYRLPAALAQFAPVIQHIIDVEHSVNDRTQDYFAYLTIDQRVVRAGTLQREAPCHVDGFQGARWKPKCLTNHTYTLSDVLPTAYYPQPFDFTGLDEAVHDFFWEMNAQVADGHEESRWQPLQGLMTLMDCYCVHRGVESPIDQPRTWLRLSFEERRRVFDRMGNAHNPLFDYCWDMVERDIEQLGLIPFRCGGDPSLSVFPWQGLDGSPLPKGDPKTKPRLSP